MAYAIMVKHTIFGRIVVDVCNTLDEAKIVQMDIPYSYIEEIDDEAEV